MESGVAGCVEVIWGEAILSDMRFCVYVGGRCEEGHPGERERKVQKN